MAGRGNIYVTRREDGRFAVSRANAGRALGLVSTQAEGIALADRYAPGVRPNVARVRIMPGGKPNQFRRT